MTHVTELALAAAFVGAVGLGALAALPADKPGPPRRFRYSETAAPVHSAEPAEAQSNAERVTALLRCVADLAAEQRELAARVRALAQEREGE